MGATRTTSVVSQPCFGLFRRGNQWQQVKCLTFISESGGVRKNLIQFPDGTEMEVANDLIVFDGRRKRFIPHPDA